MKKPATRTCEPTLSEVAFNIPEAILASGRYWTFPVLRLPKESKMNDVRVVNEMPQGIPINCMEDGDLAKVTLWDGRPNNKMVGKVVQRDYNRLIVVGEPSGNGYTDFFLRKREGSPHLVIILQPRTTLRIC